MASSNATNVTAGVQHAVSNFPCQNDTPSAKQLLSGDLPGGVIALLFTLTFCVVVCIVIYIEEIVFLLRNFAKGARLNRTIWILAFFPGFVMTSFIAVLVPRAGPLCDLVSNVFFVTCLYQFLLLMEDYLGGESNMWTVLGECREVSLRTPPCCCCCVCLPKRIMNRTMYQRLSIVVGQVTVIRTVLSFIAAVLWVNGSYIPGSLLPTNAFVYLATLNLISTLFAMWGLMVMKAATRPDLEDRFAIAGKFACIQLSIISIAVVGIITGILVTTQVIKCTVFYPSKSRAEAINHAVTVYMMTLYAIIARFFFRRQSDSRGFAHDEDGKTFTTGDNAEDHNQNGATKYESTVNDKNPNSDVQLQETRH